MGRARIIGTASPANHYYMRNLGAEPVAYGGDLVEQIRDLAPEGASVDHFLSLHDAGDKAATPSILLGGASPDR